MSFYQAMYQENMINMFNWQSWGDESRKYFNEPQLIHEADLNTVQKLFTIIIRADLFCEGKY
ncbi:DUF6508 domain-containing protein [Methanobacterium formicicum]|uniref:DUF6508 domain-containing protein n=1 Tax=Methanobacterium formicicum TaxID=2162 RepID=UPI00064FE059|nr:DUF6508 domain-containing protein [Methanobacterium formicicum]